MVAAALCVAACGDSGSDPAALDVPAADLGGGGTGLAELLPGVDAGPDGSLAAETIDAGRSEPPPEPPPADDEAAVQFLVERDGALRVARVVPAGGYVGPVGDPLPVLPADLDDDAFDPALVARDEGPRFVVDLGASGVFVGEGGAWTKLGEPPLGDDQARALVVSPGVDRVFLGYRVYDMVSFQYVASGALWAITGEPIHTFEPFPTWLGPSFGSFDVSGARVVVRDATGLSVRNAADGSEIAHVPAPNEVLALFETSLIVGQLGYPRWIDFEGAAVVVEGFGTDPWRVVDIDGVPHADMMGALHRLEDRAHVGVTQLPAGMTADSVLGYAEGKHVVGLAFGVADDAGVRDRSYVVGAPDGVVLDAFAPEPSVVEEEGGLTGVEWERRPTAVATHVDAERIAVLFEVRHTYFRGAYGMSAALTEELWVRDASGSRTHRIGQHPPVEGAGTLPDFDRRWTFTGDGAYLVWIDGDAFHALAVDTLAPVELREAF